MLEVKEGDNIMEMLVFDPEQTQLAKVVDGYYSKLDSTDLVRCRNILTSGYLIVFNRLETWSICGV